MVESPAAAERRVLEPERRVLEPEWNEVTDQDNEGESPEGADVQEESEREPEAAEEMANPVRQRLVETVERFVAPKQKRHGRGVSAHVETVYGQRSRKRRSDAQSVQQYDGQGDLSD